MPVNGRIKMHKKGGEKVANNTGEEVDIALGKGFGKLVGGSDGEI